MTTLNQRIVEIFIDSEVFEKSAITWKNYFKYKRTMSISDNLKCIRKVLRETKFVDLILKEVHENPSIKQGLKLLKEKREQDKWRREIKK